MTDQEFLESLEGRPYYTQKPFVVKYHGQDRTEDRTVFALSQEEANRIIAIKEKREAK